MMCECVKVHNGVYGSLVCESVCVCVQEGTAVACARKQCLRESLSKIQGRF